MPSIGALFGRLDPSARKDTSRPKEHFAASWTIYGTLAPPSELRPLRRRWPLLQSVDPSCANGRLPPQRATSRPGESAQIKGCLSATTHTGQSTQSRARPGYTSYKGGGVVLFTCSVADLSRYRHTTCWLITRYAGRVPRANYDEWVPDLAPSRDLHHCWSHEWRPLQDPSHWWASRYLPAWARSKTLDPSYKAAIQRAAELSLTDDLTLACWCPDETHCHRSLVAHAVRTYRTYQSMPSDPTHPLPERQIITTVLTHRPLWHLLAALSVSPPLTTTEIQTHPGTRTRTLRTLRTLEQLGLIVRDQPLHPHWSITDLGAAVWTNVLLRGNHPS